MCLSCVSPLQSVMDYWCSTDVTNKDYPCAAVCVPALPFPPCPGVGEDLVHRSQSTSRVIKASAWPWQQSCTAL